MLTYYSPQVVNLFQGLPYTVLNSDERKQYECEQV